MILAALLAARAGQPGRPPGHGAGVRGAGRRAINKFATDDPAELAAIRAHCADLDQPAEEVDVFARGGEGPRPGPSRQGAGRRPHHRATRRCTIWPSPIEKIRAIATQAYGAADVHLTPRGRPQAGPRGGAGLRRPAGVHGQDREVADG
ncbi:MAG: formate--tetrahydrofolate ligase [bacterium]